ncbi:MAG: hypothetical protein WA628_17045 [Terriglobales bacterium]
MIILGTIALIVLVLLGIMVLRVKSDPMEKESVRKILADAKRDEGLPPGGASPDVPSKPSASPD